MLAYDYNERIDMDSILNHEWMNNIDTSEKTPTSTVKFKTRFNNKNKLTKTLSDKK